MNLASCFFLIFSLIVLGCSKPSQSKLTLLLDWLPNPDHVPLFVGENEGFFIEEGIDLDIIKLVDPPSAIPYLQSKQVDVALYYMPYTLLAAQKEKDLKVLGVLIQEPLDCVMFAYGTTINESKKVLGSYPGAKMVDYVCRALQDKGISISSVKKIDIDPSLTLYLEQVDAVTGVYWNIEPYQMKSLGKAVEFIKMQDLGVPTYYELIFITRKDILERDETLRIRFQRAMQRSITFCKKHPDIAFDIYLKAQPDKTVATALWEKEAWLATLPILADSQQYEEKVFQEYLSWLQKEKILHDEVDLQGLLH